MAADGKPIIVKKVVKGGGDGHHGGAWKVAYADFVTAMMAFFLLMWLLNATTEKQRKGIADYFDPSIPLARVSAGGDGMLNGDSVTSRERRAGSAEQRLPQDEAEAPREERGPEPPAAEAPPPNDAELAAVAGDLRVALAEAGGTLGGHFMVRVTPEGLVIEIVETGGEPLFPRGSARPAARLVELAEAIAPVLALVENPISVVGHTDARPFSRPDYDNWQLSADRAAAARRLLAAAGLAPARIVEVAGRAATEPLSEDADAPENRRISLTLLREAPR